ncbi:TSL-kinase interacting protein 1-like [Diospyros lotus]|uniref:TSL-kinase interacting protein 1-like n=1 Tax=Diospyros lotus TaxID=55363 RepID=UPI002254727D|nr:TSL-kinase interacting protein 1-like [Diospyros lotus]XP_052176202.1 TSL-kinase interacting protein 1-like [Diospyros lotus]XP_052176203.1 TSL-kinase interacting protein 1-like [Diospyros lotus]
MEPQVSLTGKACLDLSDVQMKDVDCCRTTTPENHDVALPERKETRQWAAWTHQEEESFFTALQQVGKNFEKITCCVQSKSKEQVRHYYYRLLRRMNKLLGPGLCLDTKNSKDTNSAMLRWWSLLEKYSCKASKLHLKPRRFKIFIETLEHQLLKDRKKGKRKRPSQGKNCSQIVPTTISNQGRGSGHDNCTNAVLNNQSVQKLGRGRRPTMRRNVNVGISRSNCKRDSCPQKTVKKRQKSVAGYPAATISTFEFKRWEKAAIAGVSLVADAAEHLEQTTTTDVEHFQLTLGKKSANPVQKDIPNPVHKDIPNPVHKDIPNSVQEDIPNPVQDILPLPGPSPNSLIVNNMQTSSKLKLQLFPIDEGTRRALEMDDRNPHLELTLSTRKKISSVIEHLNRKWGNSNAASGELMLFPYGVQRENLVGCLRWTRECLLSAADVHALTGSLPVLRLRYGWFSDIDLVPETSQPPLASSGMVCDSNMKINTKVHQIWHSALIPMQPTDCHSDNLMNHYDEDPQICGAKSPPLVLCSPEMHCEIIKCTGVDISNNDLESSDGATTVLLARKGTSTIANLIEGDDMDNQGLRNQISFPVGEWTDSLTNVGVGDLLSQVSHDMVTDHVDPPINGSSPCLLQNPFSCDLFGAAVTAHVCRDQIETSFQPSLQSSIWDAEETCDAFSFQKNSFVQGVSGSSIIASSEACKQELPELEGPVSENTCNDEPTDDNPADDVNSANEELMDECPADLPNQENSEKDLYGLADIDWFDSLGPLDLDLRSSGYHAENLLSSDSLSSLNRLLASSLDCFQNCSSAGVDKKEVASSTLEAGETVPSSDLKVGNGV